MSSGAGGGSGGGATGDSFASARAAMTSDAAYSAPSAPAIGGNGDGGNQVIDPGFVRALDQQARIQADPSLGDPDPEVDVPTKERQDTITSFAKNLKANIAANPLMATPLGLTTTAIQTGIANAMLGNISLGSFDSDQSMGDGDGGRDLVNLLTPYAPYAMRGEIAPQSMVNQYFQNLGLGQEPLSSSLQTDYNNAKTNINSLLGILPPSQQFGYSTAPYGSLSSTNLASNPFNIDYLQQRGLI